jgi:L-2,4-diaminobutyric acid acetyltransferase
LQITLTDAIVELRAPRAKDGAGIWQLVKDTGVLDLNSPYAYLLLGEHFADTCVVAEHDGGIVGLVSAYIPPQTPDSMFVWQVGVAESMRKKGLALKMLMTLLQRESCRNITAIQTTITPANKPSQALFRAFAQAVNGELSQQLDYFRAEWFPQGSHESESLFTISPVKP